MGWSYRVEAGETLAKWTQKCLEQTGSQNTYLDRDGEMYFFSTEHTTHRDGSITGAVFQFIETGYAKEIDYFKINGDGSVAHTPVGLNV